MLFAPSVCPRARASTREQLNVICSASKHAVRPLLHRTNQGHIQPLATRGGFSELRPVATRDKYGWTNGRGTDARLQIVIEPTHRRSDLIWKGREGRTTIEGTTPRQVSYTRRTYSAAEWSLTATAHTAARPGLAKSPFLQRTLLLRRPGATIHGRDG